MGLGLFRACCVGLGGLLRLSGFKFYSVGCAACVRVPSYFRVIFGWAWWLRTDDDSGFVLGLRANTDGKGHK